MAAVGCGLHYFVLAPFGSSWIVANFSTAKICFHNYENVNHGSYSKETKKFYFQFTSYINLPDVFLLYCWVWNNGTDIII